MDDGLNPDSPVRQREIERRRVMDDLDNGVDACSEFAVERAKYKSVNAFIQTKRDATDDVISWRPSKGQMIRDMKAIFGPDWAQRRGGGGRGREGRKSKERLNGINNNMRKLFKLGIAQNMPRDAPGRLAKAYGSLASSVDQFNAACCAEQSASEQKKQKKKIIVQVNLL